MLSIHGTAKRAGVAIAVAAVVDAQHGINGVSPALLGQGLAALKKMLTPQDYPEAVVVCDMLAMGVSIRIPGVNTVGIAAQADMDVPGLEPDAPCVIGLPDLVKSVSDGDIVIVDGNAGLVHIDPDPQTLVRYQHMEDRHTSQHVVYIASEHIPARTQDGEIVTVFARITCESDLARALEEGADGLIVDADGCDQLLDCRAVLASAVGKAVAFTAEFAPSDVLQAAVSLGTRDQVTLLFGLADFDERAREASEALDVMAAKAFLADAEPPQVVLGAHAREIELGQADVTGEPGMLVVDLRKSAYLAKLRDELEGMIPAWIGARPAEDVVLMVGSHVEAIGQAVRAGARSMAVAPELVGAAKYVIRSIGLEDEE